MSIQKKPTEVITRCQLSDKFWWFELKFSDDFNFKAGQYVSVKVNEKGERRSYSVASIPGGDRIGLLVDVSPDGIGSRFFKKLGVGDKVEVLGPLGRFVVENKSLSLLFVATGSGIAPMKSMIEHVLRSKQDDGEIKLLWGLRYEKDIFWKGEFEELEKKYKNFGFELVLSKPGNSWKGNKGRVTDLINGMEDLEDYDGVFICGGNEMIDESKEILLGKGVKEESIHFERYG